MLLGTLVVEYDLVIRRETFQPTCSRLSVGRLVSRFVGWLVGFTACHNFLEMGGKLHLHALIEALAYHVQCLVQQQGLGCFSFLSQRSQQYSPQVKGVAKILGFSIVLGYCVFQ